MVYVLLEGLASWMSEVDGLSQWNVMVSFPTDELDSVYIIAILEPNIYKKPNVIGGMSRQAESGDVGRECIELMDNVELVGLI